MAIRLVTKSGNDYVPELEAVTTDEFGTMFEDPPSPRSFRVNQIVTNTFRYLGPANAGEVFYVFARLDPYEQAALMEARGQTARFAGRGHHGQRTTGRRNLHQTAPKRSAIALRSRSSSASSPLYLLPGVPFLRSAKSESDPRDTES